MSIVLDANLLVVLVLDRARAAAVEAQLREWDDAGEALHAPELQRYEVASALAGAVAAGQLSAADVKRAWELIVAIPVTLHGLEDGPAVVQIAQQLERRSAYDAAYIALADRLGGELWTLDGPLARNASSRDLPVRLIEAPDAG